MKAYWKVAKVVRRIESLMSFESIETTTDLPTLLSTCGELKW
jgi:hypothetical protein